MRKRNPPSFSAEEVETSPHINEVRAEMRAMDQQIGWELSGLSFAEMSRRHTVRGFPQLLPPTINGKEIVWDTPHRHAKRTGLLRSFRFT